MTGVITIPNQPVSFDKIIECPECLTVKPKYVQLVNSGDVTQFQVKLQPCEGAVNIAHFEEGHEHTDGDGWFVVPVSHDEGAYYTFTACREASAGESSVEIPLTASVGVYQITVVVTAVSGSFTVYLAGNDAGITLGVIDAPGTYVFTGYIQDDEASLIVINDNSEDTICFDLDSAYEICPPEITVRKSDGAFVKKFDLSFTSNFKFSKDSLTFSLNWDDDLNFTTEDYGCYYFCISDCCLNTNNWQSANLVTNGDFSDDTPPTGWTTSVNAGTGLGILNNQMEFTSNSNDGEGQAENTVTSLVAGVCYKLNYEVTDVVECETTHAQVRLVIGSHVGEWHFANGSYEESFTYDSGNITFEFESLFNDNPGHCIAIDNVVCIVADQCLPCDFCSNNFDYGDHKCTHLINACCDGDAMNFVFNGSSFSPKLRVASTIVRASYKIEKNSNTDSLGNKEVVYFNRRKIKEFRIESVAEYVHDFLSTLGGFNHFFIDGIEKVVEDDEYSIDYSTRNDTEGKSIIKISDKIQLVENSNCGDGNNNCAPDQESPVTNCARCGR